MICYSTTWRGRGVLIDSGRNYVARARGVSEVVAVFIFIGIAIALSIAFMNLLQSMYQSTHSVQLVERLTRTESLSTVVKYLGIVDDYALFLLKKLDNTQMVSFIIYSSGEYRDCSLIERIADGELIRVDRLDLRDIKVVSNGFIYDFETHARVIGLPDKGYTWICSIRLGRNTIIHLRAVWPLVRGFNITEVNSINRSWRLHGAVEFRLINDTRLYVGNSEYHIPRGSIIGIYVNSTTGTVRTRPVERGILLEELLLYYNEVFVNYTSLHRNGVLRIPSTLIDREHVKVNLVLDIQPVPGSVGMITVKHGNQTLIDTYDPVYVKVRGWTMDTNTSLRITMDNKSLNASGLAYAVYKSESPYFASDELVIITVIYVDNTPYVVDVYRYVTRT